MEMEKILKELKTSHEMPNDNTPEYNRGYVKAVNDVLNLFRKNASNSAPSESMEKKEIIKIIHESLPSKIIEALYSIGWNELGLYEAIQEALNSAPKCEYLVRYCQLDRDCKCKNQ